MEETLKTIEKYSVASVSIKDLNDRQRGFYGNDLSAFGNVLSVISQDIVDDRIVRGLIFFDNILVADTKFCGIVSHYRRVGNSVVSLLNVADR